jgi:hypothetical protein
MAKRKTQIDKAIDTLDAKKQALTDKYKAELAGIDSAIEALRKQPVRKARAAKPLPLEQAG